MYDIRPSAAWIWGIGGCHGYARMCALYPELPEVDDTIRQEGIAGHWVVEMVGKGFTVQEGVTAPNGVEVDEEMLEGAELFLNVARALGVPCYQEMTLPAYWIHPQCGGTSDLWAWDAATMTLYVMDYKYGFRYVEAFENPQLAIYVSSILDYLHKLGMIKLDGDSEQHITVEMIVVQPRGYGAEPVRRWRCKAAILRPLWNKLRAAALETQAAEPMLKAGEWCHDCQARTSCPAAQRASLECIDFSCKMLPQDLSPVAMGDALRRLERAEKFLKAMKEGMETQLLHAIRNGHVSPYYADGFGRSKKVFKEGMEEQFLALAGYMKLKDVTKPVRAKTPTQLLNVVDAAVLDRFTEVRPGRRKLVPFTDKSIRKLLQ